jgi:glyoxylase-like metal-dependent hydrolase (beta-lactamase superfamily II)
MTTRTIQTILLIMALTTPGLGSAKPVATPYGEVSLEFKLHQVPGKPVYYIKGLSGVPDSSNEGHTSNAGFVVTEEGVVVFDALGTPALGYRLLQRIREITDKPVKYVVISHYHADHIYGLQAFEQHADDPVVIAQQQALGYLGGSRDSQGEAAQRRLEQRREALFPWVDEKTYLVPPDKTFDKTLQFKLGGMDFEIRHLGPAHAPGDSILYVKQLGVLFSGDVIYKGRIPFLDSPTTNTENWLKQLDQLSKLDPPPSFIIPGHGDADDDVQQALAFTRDYISYVRQQMRDAVENFIQFDEAYKNTDWSRYQDMPAIRASNRGNAYRIYLEMEANVFK